MYTVLAAGPQASGVRLREEVQRLYEPAAVEEIARRELGLIKPGEILFIVKDAPQSSVPSR